jgi:hypothetical protein
MTSPSNAPEPHAELVRELAELPDTERRAVVAAAERAAAQSDRHVVASWRTVRAAIGVVKGQAADAMEDTARLYDG